MSTSFRSLRYFSALTPVGACLAVFTAALAPALAQEQPPQTVPDGQERSETDLRQETIVVTGQRGSIRNSIDEKRIADSISDTLSADQADRFPDQNVAEALARIPGVSFQRQNDTGDGQFISIRGLDSQFNTVTTNGLRLGTADTFRRTPLDIITGDNISSIKVTKAPLPEDPSEGIGGVVDIRTRGPLERTQDRFRFSADTRVNTFDDRLSYRVASGFNKKFGDNFGVNFSVAYRERFFDNIQINPATVVPELLTPLVIVGQDGTVGIVQDEDQIANIPTDFVPIEAFTTEQVDYEAALITRENLNISGEIDWQIHDTTVLTFGGRFSRTESTETISNIEFDVDNSLFLDANGDPFDFGSITDATGVISTLSASDAQAALAGVIRSFNDPEINFEGQIEDEIESQASLFLRGETDWNNWEFDYIFGYSRGFEDAPILSIDFTQELEDVPGSTGTGLADELAVTFAPFDLSGGEFVSPSPVNQEVFLLGLDPFCLQEDGDSCGEIVDFDENLVDSLENERYSFKFDTTYNFQNSFLEYVKAGFQWERSDFTTIVIDLSDVDDSLGPGGVSLGPDNGLPDNNTVVGELGLFTGEERSFDDIGSPFDGIGFTGIPTFSPAALRGLRETFRSSFAEGGFDPVDVNILDSEERFYSGYVQTKLQFDRLSIIGGVRLEYYDANFSAPFDFDAQVEVNLPDGMGGFEQDLINIGLASDAENLSNADNFEVLPRIAANYDLTDQIKLRASFTTALSRPDFSLLAAEVDGNFSLELAEGVAIANASLADVTQVELDVSVGNPDLRNAYSYNLDASFEYYFDEENAFSVAVFYKSIDDFIFSSFVFDSDALVGAAADPVSAFSNTPLTDEGSALIEQLGGADALFGLFNRSDQSCSTSKR